MQVQAAEARSLASKHRQQARLACILEGLSCIYHGCSLSIGPSAEQLADAVSYRPDQADPHPIATIWDEIWPHEWQATLAFLLMSISEQPSFSAAAGERAVPVLARIVHVAQCSMTRANAAKALAHAVTASKYQVPVEPAVLPSLAALLQDSTWPSERQHAALALMTLANYKSLKAQIMDVALPALVGMVEDPYAPGRQYAVHAITNLAGNVSLRSRISQAALPALVKCLQGDDLQSKRLAAVAISQLTVRADLAKPVACAALPDLVRRMQDTNDASDRHRAATLVGYLARNATLKKRICKAALGALVSCLAQPACRTNAAWALSILAASQELRPAIARTAMPRLITLLEDSSASAGRTHASRTVAHLSVGGRLRVSMVRRCIPALQSIAQDAADNAGKSAAEAALQAINDAQLYESRFTRKTLAWSRKVRLPMQAHDACMHWSMASGPGWAMQVSALCLALETPYLSICMFLRDSYSSDMWQDVPC